jgi:hypothetical protein
MNGYQAQRCIKPVGEHMGRCFVYKNHVPAISIRETHRAGYRYTHLQNMITQRRERADMASKSAPECLFYSPQSRLLRFDRFMANKSLFPFPELYVYPVDQCINRRIHLGG